MIRVIAYKWQEKEYGGLSASGQKLLDRMVIAFQKNPTTLKSPMRIKNGTRLRRLWKGKVHEVAVMPDGFIYEAFRYRSLSEIARVITGTRWNGPLFFGLKHKNRGNTDE